MREIEMLRLSIFGRFRAADALGNEIPIKSKKARALLAYLALPTGKERSREEVMALLWSERGEEQARSSLRQALSGLRKELGESADRVLKITDEWLALDPGLVAVEPASPDDVLLTGLHINDPAFDEWLRDERLQTAGVAAPVTHTPEPPLPDKPSIAVLPFVNMSGDPEQEYFSDGITEDIITELSRFREFTVMARNATFHYKGRTPASDELARELDVRYVVQGSVRRSGARLRVTAQLLDVSSSTQVWVERYDRDFEDIFAIQDELTASVVARVDDRIKGSEVARSREIPKPTAYDLVLQSRPYRTQIDSVSSARARSLLEQAIAIDPDCAQAHAGLAFVGAGEYEEGWTRDPDATLQMARAAAEQAVRLDRSDGYTHASLAYVSYLCGDFDRAMYEAAHAMDLNPNHVNIIMTMGWVAVVSGDPEAGIRYIERARQLNPNMPGFELWTLGEAYLEARRYQDAIDALLKVPDPPNDVNLELAVSYAYVGLPENARSFMRDYLNRARDEMSSFPGDDSLAWRAYFEQVHKRRHQENVEHYIAGARMAGLPI